MTKQSILYCGDTNLTGAASYLAGLMTRWGWTFDYIPSHVPFPSDALETPRSLIILSDYPAAQFGPERQKVALEQVERGCGLLMIGGWESYHGFGGNWDGTILGAALPVEIQSTDDRMNFNQSAWLLSTAEHPITQGLPWRQSPPAIGGLNRVKAKNDSTLLLQAHAFAVSTDHSGQGVSSTAPKLNWTFCESLPALVVGQRGQGRTTAFLTDVAPHWVGGFVDWGPTRVQAEAKNSNAIEVGNHYAQFWKQLLSWTGSFPEA